MIDLWYDLCKEDHNLRVVLKGCHAGLLVFFGLYVFLVTFNIIKGRYGFYAMNIIFSFTSFKITFVLNYCFYCLGIIL